MDTITYADLLLADPNRGDHVTGPRGLDLEFAVQRSLPLRGRYTIPRGRGLAARSVGFTVTRQFAGASEAWAFAQDHANDLAALAQSLAGAGALLKWRTQSGGIEERDFADAVIERLSASLRGATLAFTYSLAVRASATS